MKKTLLVLIGVAVFTAIGYLAQTGKDAKKEQENKKTQIVKNIKVTLSKTSPNTRFDNLRLKPTFSSTFSEPKEK